jgi:hypothetical protein
MPPDGEILTSYIARVAHGHGAEPGAFCRFHLRDSWFFTRDVDRGVATSKHDLLSRLSGLGVPKLEELTLQSWIVALTPSSYRQTASPAVVPWVNAVGIAQAKRRYKGLSYCPECLHDGMALKQWRLSFYNWCSVHERGLQDACARCNAPFVPHLSRRSVAHCYRCGASLCDVHVAPIRRWSAASCAWQTHMSTLLTQACAGDQKAKDDLYSLRILVSVGMPFIFDESGDKVDHDTQRLSANRVEFLPLEARLKAMTWLSNLVSAWPMSFREWAQKGGLSQRSFAPFSPSTLSSTWLVSEVEQLRTGVERNSTKRLGMSARPHVQQGSPNWRAVRAKILMKKVRPHGH